MKLSICIPTWNRCKDLDRCLNSIMGQITQEVEIIVCDNNSTDGTENMVKQYQFPIRYYKNDTNIGAEANALKVASYAIGDYIWILGDDDVLKAGKLEPILNKLNNHSVYFVNYEQRGINIKIINTVHDLEFTTGKEYIDFCLACFSFKQMDSLKLTFISSIIIKRKDWDSVWNKDKYLCFQVPSSHIIWNHMINKPFYMISDSCVVQNDVPQRIENGKKSLYLYKEWIKIYWLMARKSGNRLAFLPIILKQLYSEICTRLKENVCLGSFHILSRNNHNIKSEETK